MDATHPEQPPDTEAAEEAPENLLHALLDGRRTVALYSLSAAAWIAAGIAVPELLPLFPVMAAFMIVGVVLLPELWRRLR